MAFTALDASEVAALLDSSGRKQRESIYETAVREFRESGDAGAQIDFTQEPFLGRKVSAAISSFRRVIADGKITNVKAVQNGDNLYLIRTDLVATNATSAAS